MHDHWAIDTTKSLNKQCPKKRVNTLSYSKPLVDKRYFLTRALIFFYLFFFYSKFQVDACAISFINPTGQDTG